MPDLISMPTRSDADSDRRRSPRFNCGGLVKISCLPSDGVLIPARLRDLSLHGCAVDTALPVDYGVRTEIVVCANSASFRALGEVRVIRGSAGAGFEFIQLSAVGKKIASGLAHGFGKIAGDHEWFQTRPSRNRSGFPQTIGTGETHRFDGRLALKT
ncbi:MAG TPA: PilZ domain-containing protein [Terriglobales bacterium]|nr:PilZ domain-containing protein [Terriglobales bacterium]